MKLLSPIQIGPKEVRNRVVSTAHAAYLDFYQPGNSGERYMAYQERRAQGGTGMIITTAMHVHESSGLINHYNYEERDISQKLRQLSSRLHKHGTTAISQLFHYGAQSVSSTRIDLHPLWGFSGTHTSEGETVHEMTDGEIETVIDAFCRSALIAVESGMDGVELHGTHGYLIAQSFTPMFNKRQDKWGEPLAFITELAKRVRQTIGSDKIMGFRISSDDLIDQKVGGLGHQRLCAIASAVVGTGLFDFLNHSEGSGGAHYARAVGSFRHQLGEWLPLTKGLRDAIGAAIPVVGVGKIPTPDLAEQALQDEQCDMVGMTRAQIADPDLVRKLVEKKAHKIRICTGANQGCIDRARFPITCIQNPEVGEENRFKELAQQPTTPKRVLVIGGGPSGMKAAEIAARRGHDVTLVEMGNLLGGRINLVKDLGAPSNLLATTSWIEQELSELGVKIQMQKRVDEPFIRDFAPESIVLATGGEPTRDLQGIPDDGSIIVLSSDEAALGEFEGNRFDLKGTRALMVDARGNYESGVVLESMVNRGCQVTYVTHLLNFGANLGWTHWNDLYGPVLKKGTKVCTTSRLVGIENGKATVRHLFSGEEQSHEFDFIVAGSTAAPRNELRAICEAIAPTSVVGDAVAPRSMLEAIREGDRAGRTI